RRLFVRTHPIRELTALWYPLSPISDATLRPVRRRRACLRSIPPLQYLRGSRGPGNQTRNCWLKAFGKRACRNEARADAMDHAYETQGVHSAGWRHGRMAARGTRAAVGYEEAHRSR